MGSHRNELKVAFPMGVIREGFNGSGILGGPIGIAVDRAGFAYIGTVIWTERKI